MYLNNMAKPSIYLPVCMVIWGIISTLSGVTRKYVLFARSLLWSPALALTITLKFRGGGFYKAISWIGEH